MHSYLEAYSVKPDFPMPANEDRGLQVLRDYGPMGGIVVGRRRGRRAGPAGRVNEIER